MKRFSWGKRINKALKKTRNEKIKKKLGASLKDLSIFPNRQYDLMAIDHLKCTKGYCLLARSKTIKNGTSELERYGFILFSDSALLPSFIIQSL